jgi:predicted DNA-binding protein
MLYVVMYMGATRTQVYLSAEQRRKIDARRKREGKTMASIVRDALDAYLDRPSPSDVQKILDLTFGSMPDLVVPSRDEWERVRPAARHRRPRR